ncbi:MAG: transglutaminase domain-containing protein [Pseudomonadales bacterium]|nr:transglutaminase domain-containing protein [Candidatus Woesebacteria bacterium]MCB9800590.1 transglutaminase domain-containing protein [Pseudomonadales bacterium]
MKQMLRFVTYFFRHILALATLYLVLSTASVATAQTKNPTENFDISLTSTYTVDAVGVTKVKHTFDITNKEPTIFLTQYALKTSYPELKNVIVRYNDDVLIPNVVQDDTGTSIAIDFPDEVVGQGKTRTFSIEYSNTNLSTLAGSVLEMHIPELPEAVVYKKHESKIIVPESFGYPSRVNPEPQVVETSNNAFVLTFQNNKGSAITALFGNTQIYSLTLRYQLENSTSGTALAQIALPPDTSYQRIHIHSIDPTPDSVKKDSDGNWIATYQIAPTSATNVHVQALARITLEPNLNVPILKPSSRLVSKNEYWETDSALIQDLVRQYNTPKSIYDYIVKTLTYSTSYLDKGGTRLGGTKILQNPEAAVCQDFSDAFVTLARAANIPARLNLGYGYAENSSLRPSSFQGDVLHAWPEYWDETKQLWIPVDPTWGNTTGGIDYFNQFDLNHIVFAINGESSTTPYPAGSYKSNGNEAAQDVSVSLGTSFPEIEPQFSVTIQPKRVFGIPLPGVSTLSVQNETGQAWYNAQVQLKSDDTSSVVKSSLTDFSVILPYEIKTTTVTTYQNTISLPKTVTLYPTITVQNGTLSYDHQPIEVSSGPKIVEYITDQTVIVALAASSVVLALIAGSLLVLRQRR